ncbi:dTDP-4-dehydrorhamnose reductase [Noviherbaspirillum massiliense]|uniref:dTDP-4-dehydrorhamnose reductase n=1 Tax=Noviherbaspirillum massiliense TaxID=1465823 RepID=UPI00030738D4|nr:dTDP-4-dehydrorhamnose reductase [Noviherbaspirillum massiliense]
MKILLLGKDGQVGWELQRSLSPLGELHAFGRNEADLEKPESLRQLIRGIQPAVIVNAAAYTAVDKAESDPEKARQINAQAPGVLAEEADRLNAWLVHYSTDYVFDGKKSSPYEEDDLTNPISVYGQTKLEGERLIRDHHAKHLIFRTSWVYAARGGNFAKTMLRLAKERNQLKVIADQYGAPTSAELIADVTALVLHRIGQQAKPEFAGAYHLTAGGHTTWHAYAQYVLQRAESSGAILKAKGDAVQPIPSEAYPLPAVRPKNSRLDTTKLTQTFDLQLPEWQYHVRRLIDELSAQGAI